MSEASAEERPHDLERTHPHARAIIRWGGCVCAGAGLACIPGEMVDAQLDSIDAPAHPRCAGTRPLLVQGALDFSPRPSPSPFAMSSLPADVAKRVSDYLHQALSACDRRDWSAATLMFTMLLKVDPGNGEALLHRANVHLQGAKTAKALADVEACLALPNAAIYAVHATYLQAHIMLLQGRAGQTLAIVDQFLRTADPAAYPQLVDFRPRMEALRMEALQFVEARRQAFAAKEEDDVEFFMHYDDMSKFELLKEHFLSSGELPCAQCHAMYQCEAQAFRLASAPLCALCSDGGATATNVQAAAPPVASAAPLAQQPTPMAHITQQVQAMAIRPASAVQMGAPMNGHVFPSAVDRGQYNPPGFGAFAAATQAFAASPFALHGQHQAPQASGGSVSEPADPFHRLIQHQQQYQPPPQQQQPPASGGSASAPADPFHRLIEHQQQQYQPPPQQQQPPHQSHGPSPPSSIANASAPVDFDAAAVDFSVAPADFEPYDDLERMIAGEVDSFDPDGGVYFEQHKDDEGDAGQEFQHQPQDEPDEPTRHSEEGQPPARAPSSTPAAVPSAAPAAAKGWTSIAAALPAALTIAAAAPPSSKAKAKVWAPPIPGYHRGTWDGWSKSEPKMGSLTWEKKKVACWETRLQCERSGLKLGSPVDFTVHVKENGELAVAVLRLAQRMDSAVAPTATPSTPPDELAKQLHRGIWTGWQQGSKESIFGSIQYRKDGTGEILVISAHINGLKDPRECFEVGTIVRFVFRPEIGQTTKRHTPEGRAHRGKGRVRTRRGSPLILAVLLVLCCFVQVLTRATSACSTPTARRASIRRVRSASRTRRFRTRTTSTVGRACSAVCSRAGCRTATASCWRASTTTTTR